MKYKIGIIGAGTYGSYIVDSLQRNYPNVDIVLYEVGNSTIKSEKEIGFSSFLKKDDYKGLSDGRWFGYGGTSEKWGGQILKFSLNDFNNTSNFMRELIIITEKRWVNILNKLNISEYKNDTKITVDLNLKTGVWLSLFKRNFFRHFKIAKRKNVIIKSNTRVTNISLTSDSEKANLTLLKDGCSNNEEVDFVFLAAGAFESVRLLMNSGIINDNKVSFGDHISKSIFNIQGPTKIGNIDFAFKLKGTSLETTRIVGEIDDISYYCHPVFNSDYSFFQALKNILFKKTISFQDSVNLIKGLKDLFKFSYTALIKRKIYVKNNNWNLYLDVENFFENNFIELSDKKDKYNQFGIDVSYSISEESLECFDIASNKIELFLKENNVNYTKTNERIGVKKMEDIYHPYGMLNNMRTVKEYFEKYDKLLLVSTAILPKSGSINPTAALFPLIDEFVENTLKFK